MMKINFINFVISHIKFGISYYTSVLDWIKMLVNIPKWWRYANWKGE